MGFFDKNDNSMIINALKQFFKTVQYFHKCPASWYIPIIYEIHKICM